MSDYRQSRGFQASVFWDSVYRQGKSGFNVPTHTLPVKEDFSKPSQNKSLSRGGANTACIDRLLESLNNLLQEFPEKKQAVLDKLGNELLKQVRTAIGGSGKVQGWQAVHMGSGGGYVAVRPKKKTYEVTRGGKRYAVGYITNAIEGGHKHGGPRGGSGRNYRYRPRYHTPAVPGKYFYQSTRQDLAAMTDDEIQALIQRIVDGLEGRL